MSLLLWLVPLVSASTLIYPGEVRVLELPHHDAQNARVYCRDRQIPAQRNAETYVAILAEPYASKREPFSCRLMDGEKVLSAVEFEVRAKAYEVENLRVPARLVKLSERDQAQYDDEQATLKPVYAASAPTLLVKEAFTPPLASRVTSPYGIRRVLNGDTKSEHTGVDFRAPVGTSVPAANAGRVAFVGQLMRSGRIVILDHGLGVFTQYHHLSKALVKTGDTVTKGQTIALSGNTGRASGPHLHWAARVQGEFVDGFSLINETKTIFK